MDRQEFDHTTYHSYLLRVWWDAAQHMWHVSLQSTVTQHTYHFASGEALLSFLLGEPIKPTEGNPMLPDPSVP